MRKKLKIKDTLAQHLPRLTTGTRLGYLLFLQKKNAWPKKKNKMLTSTNVRNFMIIKRMLKIIKNYVKLIFQLSNKQILLSLFFKVIFSQLCWWFFALKINFQFPVKITKFIKEQKICILMKLMINFLQKRVIELKYFTF